MYFVSSLLRRTSTDSEGGGDQESGPPEICQRWGPVYKFDGYERSPEMFLSYYYHFFGVASLASIIHRLNV